MKRKFSFLSFIVLGIISLTISCKDDNEHVDPLLLTDGMNLTVSIKNSIYSPTLFDNYVVPLKRDSLNGTYLDGRKLILNAQLNSAESLQIALTNWEVSGGHPDGVIVKPYIIYDDADTTGVIVNLGDSSYTDKPTIRYTLADGYVYCSNRGLPGSVNISYCNPLKRYINGTFTAGLVALPPNSDTLYIQGSFTHMQYYKKLSE
jgi:hypothetical protein